jgi:hypothetical protein
MTYLELRPFHDNFGMRMVEVRLPEGTPKPSLAEFGYEMVARLLAEPLRKALDGHLDEHNCGTGDTSSPDYVGGFTHCPEAKRLWDLLPDGDRILLA